MRTWHRAAVVGLCVGCSSNPKPPGEEIMGTFSFTATPSSNDCLFAEIPDGGFSFDATFSRQKVPGTQAYVTVAGANRDAGFDGQTVVSEFVAPRLFTACPLDSSQNTVTMVDETLRVALLSASQDDRVGNTCPSNALDGGLPGPDAGVSLPGSQPPSSFDA